MSYSILATTFCTRCGSRNKIEELDEFDTNTGHPLTKEVCSSDPCFHNGCHYQSKEESYRGFWSLWRQTTRWKRRCIRCSGKSIPIDF